MLKLMETCTLHRMMSLTSFWPIRSGRYLQPLFPAFLIDDASDATSMAVYMLRETWTLTARRWHMGIALSYLGTCGSRQMQISQHASLCKVTSSAVPIDIFFLLFLGGLRWPEHKLNHPRSTGMGLVHIIAQRTTAFCPGTWTEFP